MNKTPLCIAIAMLLPMSAKAEQRHVELDAITVTAEKREGQARDVPAAITVVSDAQLDDAGITDTEGFVNEVPNMHMIDAGNHSTAGFFALRGITPVMEGEQSVGFFVDGVYHSTFDATLFDVERIEVLKGPQGSLYGRNTLAGVVNVINKPTTEDWQGEASLDYGEFNTLSLGGAVSGPLVKDRLLMRLAARQDVSDGGFDNAFDGSDTPDERDDLTVRGRLNWLATEHWRAEWVSEFKRGRANNGSFALIDNDNGDPHTVNLDYVGFSDLDASANSVHIHYTGDDYTLTAITAYTDEQIVDSIDLDFTAADMMRLDTDVDIQRVSQEVRFASPERSDWEWLGVCISFKKPMRQTSLSI
ncbi:MAG TPA: hypothetical protein DD979_08565 [Gammaproteobacteria bacterium]|jgi:iron complex outermembrane receptor protein|nr:hypothetical protein [Gammaproteobacteria bacterium]